LEISKDEYKKVINKRLIISILILEKNIINGEYVPTEDYYKLEDYLQESLRLKREELLEVYAKLYSEIKYSSFLTS
jgi:hypothetical protein